MEKHIQNRFPEYEAKFHTNRRNFYIHMCTDKSLFSFENYKLLLQEIDNFLTEHIEHKFTAANLPKLIFLQGGNTITSYIKKLIYLQI